MHKLQNIMKTVNYMKKHARRQLKMWEKQMEEYL